MDWRRHHRGGTVSYFSQWRARLRNLTVMQVVEQRELAAGRFEGTSNEVELARPSGTGAIVAISLVSPLHHRAAHANRVHAPAVQLTSASPYRATTSATRRRAVGVITCSFATRASSYGIDSPSRVCFHAGSS